MTYSYEYRKAFWFRTDRGATVFSALHFPFFHAGKVPNTEQVLL